MRKEKKKNSVLGFTLIELLAVIIILGIMMLIAIPSVTAYINNSKKEAYINTAKEYIKGAANIVNTGKLDMFDINTTYYIPTECIPLETGGESPFGKFDPAYVVVTYDNNSYDYYWVSRDTTGMGIKKVTLGNDLNSKLIESGITKDNVKPNVAVESRSQIKILDATTCTNMNEGEVEGSNEPVEPYITYVNKQDENQITVGDEVAIDSEHFYVISTNSSETVLLAKYNLYVGGSVTKTCTSYDCATMSTSYTDISKTDSKYGLQSNIANAYNYIKMSHTSNMNGKYSTSYGFVAFAGTNYWDNSVCQYRTSRPYNEDPFKCEGTKGLLEEYANSSNAAGITYYNSVYPYVYKSSMSSAEYQNYRVSGCIGNPNATGCGYTNYAGNNGYTIAYYVEEYISRLKTLGASRNIKGRLLTHEEANSLSSDIKGNTQNYWLGSASSYTYIKAIFRGNDNTGFFVQPNFGVRPVIVVPTSEI